MGANSMANVGRALIVVWLLASATALSAAEVMLDEAQSAVFRRSRFFYDSRSE